MSLAYKTHGLGKAFWHRISLKKKSSLIHTHPSHEPEPPYRWSKSIILRLPFTTLGVVIGWWRKIERSEEDAILAGMSGRDMSYKQLVEEKKEQPIDIDLLIADALEY